MKKDVLISIKGTQMIEGESDTVELTTDGSYYFKDGSYYISYMETEATGYDHPVRTTLKIDPKNCVTMLRYGRSKTQFIVESTVRHQCFYNTGFGGFTVGVTGSKIESDLGQNGGTLLFQYSLDLNSALTSENEILVTVKERTSQPN